MKKNLLTDYRTEEQVAKAIRKTVRTLRVMRQRGEGPPYIKVARTVYYPEDGLAAWLKTIEVQPVRSGRRRAPNKQERLVA